MENSKKLISQLNKLVLDIQDNSDLNCMYQDLNINGERAIVCLLTHKEASMESLCEIVDLYKKHGITKLS